MPRSPTVPQPRRSTLVDSMITRPAPPAANLPAFMRCQSVAKPLTAEYWCIGAMTTRFLSVMPRSAIGVNSSGSAMFVSLDVGVAAVGSRHSSSRAAGSHRLIPAREMVAKLLLRRLQRGHGDGDGVALGGIGDPHLARSLEHRIGDRANVRGDPLQIAQH